MDCFPPERPLYYYITDRSRLDGRSFTACVRRTLAWGVDFIQIREKDLSDRALYALARRIVALARGTGAGFWSTAGPTSPWPRAPTACISPLRGSGSRT